MKMRSVLIASLGAAKFGPVDEMTVVDGGGTFFAGPVKVPVGSKLCSLVVGHESVFLTIEETDDPEEEVIDVQVLADGQHLKRARWIGSFVYPYNGDHQRPMNPSQERGCIAHVVEVIGADNHPRRKFIPSTS
jgi:hypothetical protein